MPNYSYTAKDERGKTVYGTVSASDEMNLANKISRLGYFLLKARVLSEISSAVKIKSNIQGLNPKDALTFTIHLATMLDSGIPLAQAMRNLSESAEKENIKKMTEDIRFRVESGSSLKAALSRYPKSFPPIYTAIVGAGEETGKMPLCLNNLVDLLEWNLELKGKVKEAMTYPVILFCVMTGVVALLVIKVIPTFAPIFKDLGANLPLPTQIVLKVSDFVRGFWYVIIGLLVLTAGGYQALNSTARGGFFIDSLKLKLPLFGSLLRKVAISRFCRTFSLTLKSGVNILSSLEIAGEVIGNRLLAGTVRKARDSVNIGEKLTVSLANSREFPPLVIQMISAGEQSGSLSEALDRVNRFYDREVPASIRRMFAVFEPLMIIFMAVVVGGVALAIFLPIFQMSQLIGG